MNRAHRRAQAKQDGRASRTRKVAALSSGAVLALGAAGVAVNAVGPAAQASVTDTVSNTADSGTGSLRDAMIDAGNNGGGTITFDAAVSGTISLETDLPHIADPVTITGPTSGAVTIDANGHHVFYVTDGETVTISNLTVTNSDWAPFSNWNGSSLTVDHVVVTGNHTGSNNRGGGFDCGKGESKSSTLVVTNSLITGNTTEEGGGGLYTGYCDVTIVNTEISGNRALTGTDGGGLYADGGTLHIENSTIANNYADDNSGGVYLDDGIAATISNSTIANNTTHNVDDPATGISVGGGSSLDLIQSTVTGNHHVGTLGRTPFYGGLYIQGGNVSSGAASTAGNDQSAHAGAHSVKKGAEVGAQSAGAVSAVGTIISGNGVSDVLSGKHDALLTSDHSLLGVVESSVTVDDLGGTQTGVTDAKLGPLQNNGGPTSTMALLEGSPAIDAGPDPVPTFPLNDNDQRGTGFPRVVNGKVDIGAFEVQPPPVVELAPKFTG